MSLYTYLYIHGSLLKKAVNDGKERKNGKPEDGKEGRHHKLEGKKCRINGPLLGRKAGRKDEIKVPGGCVRIVQFARPFTTCVDISWVTVSEIPWFPLVQSRNMVETKQHEQKER